MSPEAREQSFDELAKGLASGSISRGRALRLMGAALVGGTLGSLGGVAAADEECKPEGKKCRKNNQCCSGFCSKSGTSRSGTCACQENGGTCTSGTECCSGNCVSRTCSACPSGYTQLSNGTCAQSCGSVLGCTEGCVCFSSSANPLQGYCGRESPGSSCLRDADCPTGQFCAASGVEALFCVPAC